MHITSAHSQCGVPWVIKVCASHKRLCRGIKTLTQTRTGSSRERQPVQKPPFIVNNIDSNNLT